MTRAEPPPAPGSFTRQHLSAADVTALCDDLARTRRLGHAPYLPLVNAAEDYVAACDALAGVGESIAAMTATADETSPKARQAIQNAGDARVGAKSDLDAKMAAFGRLLGPFGLQFTDVERAGRDGY